MKSAKSSPPSFSSPSKSPRESAIFTRKIVASDMLNPNGTLFGGVIMSWIDEVAFMSARRYSGRPFVVTASIDNITFVMPLRTGEHVVLTAQVNYVGRTSMEIGVKVERENPYTDEREQATSAYLTFVALDEGGKPCPLPQLLLETDEDRRRHEEASVRVKVRARLKLHFKRKLELNKLRQQQSAASSSVPPGAPSEVSREQQQVQADLSAAFLTLMSSFKHTWNRYLDDIRAPLESQISAKLNKTKLGSKIGSKLKTQRRRARASATTRSP